ncbi:MAG: WYL domain-containing protein [Bacteroidales bacterium]|nr:WYL domain-containing protein [Bacteroidales bacterium]
MAINKNALIRYRTIDKCLQNKYRKWTLNDLIAACSEVLYEYEGRKINVSKRTIQLDIQIMRSDKLGYNAPIVVYDKKYYKYEDPDFSIRDIPLNETDMDILSETVEILKQFKNVPLLSELKGMINKLEDTIYTNKNSCKTIIFLDKNENLKGLEHTDFIYNAILKQICLNIAYKRFDAKHTNHHIIHPYILKEYNNRWFVVGKENKSGFIYNYALDRIEHIDYALETEFEDINFDGDEFYKNTIGVTVLNDKYLEEIVLKVQRKTKPYILTKPLHTSQKVVKKFSDGSIIIKIYVHLNFELDRLILGFGSGIEVLKPAHYRGRIKQLLNNALNNYKK